MGLPTPKWGDFVIRQIEYVRNNFLVVLLRLFILLFVISLLCLGYTKITEKYPTIYSIEMDFDDMVTLFCMFNWALAFIYFNIKGAIGK